MLNIRNKIVSKFDRIPIALAVSIVAVSLLFICALLVGKYSLDVLVENKQKDSSAIIFLDLNRTSTSLSEYLVSRSNVIDTLVKKNSIGAATHIITIANNKRNQLKGTPVPSTDVRRWLSGTNEKIFLTAFEGRPYMVKKAKHSGKTYLSSWRINLTRIMAPLATPDTSLYLSDKEGKILFSSDPRITDLNLVNQATVQSYMRSPLKEQFIKVQDSKAQIFGYGSALKNSNAFLFVEVSEQIIKRKVDHILVDYLKAIGLLILISLVVVFLSIEWIVGPLKELVSFVSQIATGNFAIRLKEKTFGELRILMRSINFMTQGLATRDKQIFELIEQQRTKLRMEMELDVARDLQGNLLPKKEEILSCKGIEIASKYEAAGECAGDWYGVWFDPVKNRNIVCIADVAGHGAGPSLFTAVIASIFFENQSPEKGFDEDLFVNRLNQVFMKIGQNQWHATLQLAIFNVEGTEVEIINAGHCFPTLIPSEEKKKVKRIVTGSQPIGIEPVMKVAKKKIKLKQGDNMVFYTDGILEGENHEKEQYGAKRFLKTCTSLRSRGTKGIMDGILADWSAFRDGVPAPDDVCILSVRTKRGG